MTRPVPAAPRAPARLRRFLGRLRGDQRGLALIEFAYAAPIMLTLGMYGLEAANLALVNMRVSQVTANLADTASRIGLDSTLALKEIRESDIDDAFQAVRLQGGSYNITTTGRVILSSLEQNANGGQWIHWQRCVGQGKDATNTFFTSNYGVQGDGAVGQPAITGMGPTGGKIAAPAKQAVMFVETQYTYKPLISSRLFGTPVIKSTAAFIVRDIRNLADANNPSNAAGATSMTCDKHTT
jgi:Flp pilus assembly protein TadG